MDNKVVDLADRYSRKRAVIAAVAALVFLGVQIVTGPRVFAASPPSTRIDWWAVNAAVLLAVLATGGGVLNTQQIRSLVHDEISRRHIRLSVSSGYWVAMGLGLVLYLAPWFRDFTSRQAIYVIVTASVVAPLLMFALLEHRALSGG